MYGNVGKRWDDSETQRTKTREALKLRMRGVGGTQRLKWEKVTEVSDGASGGQRRRNLL